MYLNVFSLSNCFLTVQLSALNYSNTSQTARTEQGRLPGPLTVKSSNGSPATSLGLNYQITPTNWSEKEVQMNVFLQEI